MLFAVSKGPAPGTMEWEQIARSFKKPSDRESQDQDSYSDTTPRQKTPPAPSAPRSAFRPSALLGVLLDGREFGRAPRFAALPADLCQVGPHGKRGCGFLVHVVRLFGF